MRDGYPGGVFFADFVRQKGGKYEWGWYINPIDDKIPPMLITPDGEVIGPTWDLSIDWDRRA